MHVILQILYINSLVYGKIKRDPTLCPIVFKDATETGRFLNWLNKKGRIATDKVYINRY